MTVLLMPSTVLAWTAPDNINVSKATYYPSGALKEITASFRWNTVGGVTGRFVLMTNLLRSAGEAGTNTTYGDFTDYGYYGDKFDSFRDVLDYDNANGTFGIVYYDNNDSSIDGGANTMKMSFAENTLPLNTNKTYYVYLWTNYRGHTYPDTLICTIQVNNGAVKYASATGRNTYDTSFSKLESEQTYNVTVTAAEHMTKTADSGAATQNGLKSAMTPVVYTADSGYCFDDDYSVETVNGIMVRRDNDSQITVYGTPSADASVILFEPSVAIPLPPSASLDYTIKFNANGGSGTMADMTIAENAAVRPALTANSFTYSGYEFEGWTDTPNGDTVTYADKATAPSGRAGDVITLYAKWRLIPTTYTIKFDANGGSGTMTDMTVGTDAPGALTANSFTRTGYVFAGWTDTQGDNTVKFADKATAPTGTAGDEITLYAVWNKRSSGRLGGSAVYHTVKFDTDGGSVLSELTVVHGGYATKPTTPSKEGYTFDDWYTDKELTAAYDFGSGVTANITLYAKWIADEVQEPSEDNTDEVQSPADDNNEQSPITDEWVNPFNDVSEKDWFFGSVMDINKKGLMSGTTATSFAPSMTLTRAMLVTILWKAEGEPQVDFAMPFTDVDDAAYYAEAVRWAVSENIAKGISETEFAPDANITREQITAILYRYAEYKGYDVTQGGMQIREFDDFESIAAYAINAMTWAVNTELMKGKTASALNPKDFATRAEAAAILKRFIELYR